MYITFKELNIQNFMSIGQAHIDFTTTKGFNLIQGNNTQECDNAKSNGSGKSSIFESLIWVLCGETLRGSKNVVNMNTQGGCKVYIKFSINNDTYEITRTKEHKELKNNLIIIKNGKDISGKGIRDSEKILNEYLPDLTSSLIGSVILLGQGLPMKFTSNSPSGRKEVLESLFKADFMIQDIKDRIKIRISELNSELREIQDSMLILNTKLETNNRRLEDDIDRLNELKSDNNIDSTISNLNLELDNYIKEKDNYDSYLLDKNNLVEKYKEYILNEEINLRKDLENIENSYKEKINSLYESKVSMEKDLNYTKLEIDKILNIQDICPTCGQKIPNVKKPDITPYKEKYDSLYEGLSRITRENDEINDKQAKEKFSRRSKYDINIKTTKKCLDDTLKGIQDTQIKHKIICDEISNISKKLQDKKKLKDILDYEVDKLNNDISELKVDIKNIENEKDLQCLKLQEVNKRHNIISSFNTIVSRDFRGYLIKDIVTLIENQAKSYCKQVFNTDLIHFYIDGNNLYIGYNNKEYEALSGGERQKIDIIIQFAIRDTLSKHMSFSSNLLILDEIFDNLDTPGCQNIIDLITNNLKDIEDIFIISHHSDELNIPYDSRLVVTKGNDGVSHINVI